MPDNIQNPEITQQPVAMVAPAQGMKIQEIRSGTYATLRRIFLSTPERKSYTMLGLTLIAVVIVIVFVIRPMLITIADRRTEISILTTDSKFLNERISTVLSIQEDMARYKDELSTFFDYFPGDQNISEILRDLFFSAENLGLTVVDISAGRADYLENTSTALVPGWLTVTVWGTNFDSILGYINEVEDMPNYPSVEQITITVDDGMYRLICRVPISTVNSNIILFKETQ
ncbi:hypothetical protein JW962_03550 [Candidatus Dojkabacteria bacterium]|nr:hypothetical protein [Candidatus Dojkabacteria bacterium]